MEMTYDGALGMPKNFAVVDEEEMTYVDGGIYKSADYYFSTGYLERNWCEELGGYFWGLYACGITCSTAAGMYIGSIAPGLGTVVGGIVGALVGCFASDIFADWAKTFDNAAYEASKKRTKSCRVNVTLSNLTLIVSVC